MWIYHIYLYRIYTIIYTISIISWWIIGMFSHFDNEYFVSTIINNTSMSIFIYYYLPGCAACGILVPWLGIELRLQQWKSSRVWTTGLPGNSQYISFCVDICYHFSWVYTKKGTTTKERGCWSLDKFTFNLWGTAGVFSIAALFYIPTSKLRGFQFLYILL